MNWRSDRRMFTRGRSATLAALLGVFALVAGPAHATDIGALQSGQAPGTSTTYIYTLEKAYTKADLKPDTCWDVKALQAAQ